MTMTFPIEFALWTLGGFVAAEILSAAWSWIFLPLARRRRAGLDVLILTSIRAPAQWTVVTAALYMGIIGMSQRHPSVIGQIAWIAYTGLVYVALVLAATVMVYSTARAFTEWHATEARGKAHTILNDQFMMLFRKTAGFVFTFIALTIILGHFGVQITGLLATAGVASLAIALAAQETLSNMIAGFALITDGAFRPGDRIELANGKAGDVLEVGLRSTRITTDDNTIINIPNSEIAKNQIVNLSAPDPRFKIRATLGVAYGTDLRKTKAILFEIFKSHPDVLPRPEPEVFFTEFGDSSLTLRYGCWVADYRDQYRVRDSLNMAIKDRFEAEGVQIPFPQRDVHIR